MQLQYATGYRPQRQSSTAVHGGSLHLTLSQLPDESLVQWGLKSTLYNLGAIVLFDEHNNPLERILFQNAACVHFSIEYIQSGNAYISTDLIIYAEKLTIGNGVNFDNN